MKMLIGIVAALTLGLVGSAQRDGKVLLNSWTDSVNQKDAMSAVITVQKVGGVKDTYTVNLKKPNMARIDSKSELVIADGKEITVYDKKGKIFYKKPQTEKEFKLLLKSDAYAMVAPFFDKKGFSPTTVRELAPKPISGQSYRVLEAAFGSQGKKTFVIYVPSDSISKKIELQLKNDSAGGETVVMNAQITTSATDEMFAFSAPDGVKEVQYEDLIASRWFEDFDEAALIAEKTGKMIFIDFMATWCGPCKKMAAEVFETEEFKALGKKVVFCKIDIDLNPALAEKYKVDAIPHVFVVKPNGTSVGDILGYGDKAAFLEELTDIVEGASQKR